MLPELNIDDPKYDHQSIEHIVELARSVRSPASDTLQYSQHPQNPVDDAQMRSMVNRAGSLDLDDTGFWDYHGHSSGYSFIAKFRSQFGESFLPNPKPLPENKNLSHVVESPKSLHSSPFDVNGTLNPELPSREVAVDLCRNAIDDCLALQRPIHRPTFFKRLHSLYDTDPENYTNNHIRFIPLLYIVMAVGCLFARTDDDANMLDKRGYTHAVEQGYQFFHAGKSMLDITDCRDLLSIQTVMFMILFLQGTAKLATCYAYVGIALRGCCRLGMHRKIKVNFNPVEQEERKRIFWQVRKMDSYVGAMLGLPQMLNEDDIDQDLPAEVNDEYINEEAILPMPQGKFSLHKATNAHTKLMHILQKVVRYVYPVKLRNGVPAGDDYTISHSLIRELERDLQVWMDELPVDLRPSENADRDLSRWVTRNLTFIATNRSIESNNCYACHMHTYK